jgi:hypothetical protein
MGRELVWIKQERFEGWGCSEFEASQIGLSQMNLRLNYRTWWGGKTNNLAFLTNRVITICFGRLP